jgi:hypothetical protein
VLVPSWLESSKTEYLDSQFQYPTLQVGSEGVLAVFATCQWLVCLVIPPGLSSASGLNTAGGRKTDGIATENKKGGRGGRLPDAPP